MKWLMYRTLLLDFGMVLVFFNRKNQAWEIWKRIPNCPLGVDEIHARICDSNEGVALLNLFEIGMITPSQYRTEITGLLGFAIAEWDFWTHHTNVFTEVNHGLIVLINEIRSRHPEIKRVIGVTDVDPIRFPVAKNLIEEAGLAFDKVVTSFHVGCQKPNRDVWRYIENVIGVDPSTSVFIDDMGSNIKGARDHGFTAIRYPSDWLPPREATNWLREQLRWLGFRV